MAINPIRFVGPRPEPRKEKEEKMSDLEKVLLGLKIVQQGFGIATNFVNIKGALEKQEQDKIDAPKEREAFEAEQQRLVAGEQRTATEFAQKQELREGFVTPQQKLALEAKGVTFRPPQKGETPEFFAKTPGGVEGPAAPLVGDIKPKQDKMQLKLITSEAPDGTTKSMLVDISQGKLNKLDEVTIQPGTEDMTVGQKIAALPTAEKTKLSQVAGAVDALNRMEQAISQGDALVSQSEILADIPIVGDRISKFGESNPATIYRRLFAEMFGRLQTGAAITKSEEERFNLILATAGDNPDQIREKFDSIRLMLGQRVRMNNIEPQDFYQHMKIADPVTAPQNQQQQPQGGEGADRILNDFLK
jgi:hypothetical protein